MGGELGKRIAARARRFGPLPWSVFMEMALYDSSEGFYQAGGRAGRDGDFVTSPELGPLFASVIARALDRAWEELGRPDPFVVVEAAAGVGTLARDLLAASPACAPALRYVLVERSAALRAAQADRLPIEMPALVLGPAAGAAPSSFAPELGSGPSVAAELDEDDDARLDPGRGPLVTSLAELPALLITGVVFANELLDNLPFDLIEWREGGWHEVRVAVAGDTAVGEDTDELIEMLVPAAPDLAGEATRFVGGYPTELAEGARIPVQRAAVEWLRQALDIVETGRVILIDYVDTTGDLARRPWTDWLRTFRRHQTALFPTRVPGRQDITCVVALDQLAAVRLPDQNQAQAEWLAELGLPHLVAAAGARWRERAAIGDLAALADRSRVGEAEALTDPRGLGGHRVLEWIVR